jgi:hypothetical protein
MRTLLLSIVIGWAAGIVDIVPMLLQRLDKKSIVSAFLQYLFVSIVIVNIDLPGIAWWLQGGIISFALSLPVVIIVSGKDRKAVPIILAMSVILGTLVGVAGHFVR